MSTTSFLTPWGYEHWRRDLAPGVCFSSAEWGGGFLVHQEVVEIFLSERAQAIGTPWRGFLTYGEDIAENAVYYEHPSIFPEKWVQPITPAKIQHITLISLKQNYPWLYD